MDNKKTETKVVKPFVLELNDAKNEIMASISTAAQKHNIPFFLLKDILADALRQAENGARAEVENAQATYSKQLVDQTEPE